MIESISGRLAYAIKNSNPQRITTSVEVMQFALISIIGHVITFVVSFVVSAILGTLIETFIVLFSFMFLRWFSGGYHFRSPELCAIVSIFGVVLIPHLYISPIVNLVLLIISIILILLFAPVGENHSRIFEDKHKPILKIFSLLIVCSNFVFNKDYLTIAFFVQTLSFIPLFLKGGETQ